MSQGSLLPSKGAVRCEIAQKNTVTTQHNLYLTHLRIRDKACHSGEDQPQGHTRTGAAHRDLGPVASPAPQVRPITDTLDPLNYSQD